MSESVPLLEVTEYYSRVLLCTEDEVPDFALVRCCTVYSFGSFVDCSSLCIWLCTSSGLLILHDGGMHLLCTEGEVLDFGLVYYCTECHLDSFVVFCILCTCL